MPDNRRAIYACILEQRKFISAPSFFQNIMSKSRLLHYARLALCASSIAAVGTYDSPAKESNKQAR
jgi:hypothetical protein